MGASIGATPILAVSHGGNAMDFRVEKFDELRRQTENLLSTTAGNARPARLPNQLSTLIDELRLYEAELRLQNEELRRAQEELRILRDRYFDLYDRAPVGYFTLNRRGMITEVNLAGAVLLGIPRSEMGLQGFSYFVGKESTDRYLALRSEVLRSGTTCTQELTLRRQDGVTIEARVDCAVDHDMLGELAGWRLLVSDVTEEHRLRNERTKLQERLEQAQKLETIGVLAGGVAHDFNNILAGILGLVELTLQSLPLTTPEREPLTRIAQLVDRGAELASQLLVYSGRKLLVLEPTELSALVESLMPMLAAAVDKRVVLAYHPGTDLAWVQGDANQLRQVIVNLVTNAAEAIDGSGTVTITTGVRYCDSTFLSETVVGAVVPAGHYVCLEVADTGCGMDSVTCAKMFEPFFSTKFPGRGLGLAALLGIVRSHGGAIRVKTEIQHGTSIMVILPLAPNKPAAVLKSPHEPAGQDWQGSGLVLVADDEREVRWSLRYFLEKLGFKVLEAVDGREAVELFRRHAEEVVLTFLDMKMPEMRGPQVLREMRRIRGDATVILCSGYVEASLVDELAEQGFAGFLHKPFRPDLLLETVRKVLPG